jgi:hypothetical protein
VISLPIDQIISLVGAFLILIAFMGNQFGWMNAQSMGYQVLNLVGALLLTATATIGHQYGFIVLEGTWSVVSFIGVLQSMGALGPRA